MSTTTFWVYIAMYIYGFSLTLWSIFFDKHPTQTSLKVGKFGLFALALTLFYFIYVIWTYGIH